MEIPNKSNQRSLFKGLTFSIGIIIIGLTLTYIIHRQLITADQNRALKNFKQVWQTRMVRCLDKFHKIFFDSYVSLRTVAMLPGVRNFDIKDQSIDENAQITVQQIYNNLVVRVNVSGLYVITNDFDPEKSKPIAVFDQLVVDKASISAHRSSNVIDAVSLPQYREMKKNLDYFTQKYPSVKSFPSIQYPAATSAEVLTTDNNEVSSKVVNLKDPSRNGLVYSVPFYDSEGQIKGVVSVVLRSYVISRVLGDPYFFVSVPEKNLHIVPFGFSSQMIRKDMELLQSGKTPNKYPFVAYERMQIYDGAPWYIGALVPDTVWIESDLYYPIQVRSRLILTIGALVSLILALIFWVLYYTKVRAQHLATIMTNAYKESQKQLIHSQRLESVGLMASGLADAFSNFINVIRDSVRPLLSEFESRPDTLKRIQTIQKSAENAAGLTGKLMGFAHKGHFEPKELQMGEIIDEVSELLFYSLDKSILLYADTPKSLWHLRGDRSQVLQVIMNLVINAKDAMPQGGKIHIEATNVLADSNYCKKLKGLKEGEYVCLRIKDTGSGIPPEVQEKIFDPFFTTKEVGKGTGLGLSVTYGIVQAHNGYITFETQQGVGTMFRIYFPKYQNEIKREVIENEIPPPAPIKRGLGAS